MRALFLSLFLLPLVAHAQKAGDAVQIEHNGTWYDGKVLQVKDGQFFITYNEWDESWNEWVGADRLKAGAPAPTAAPAEKKF